MYFLIRLVFKGTDEAGGDHLSTSVDSLNNEVLKWLIHMYADKYKDIVYPIYNSPSF